MNKVANHFLTEAFEEDLDSKNDIRFFIVDLDKKKVVGVYDNAVESVAKTNVGSNQIVVGASPDNIDQIVNSL